VGTRTVHAVEWLLCLLRAEPRHVSDHHLGEPDDGVERGAQLVAHAGEELRLVLARHFQLAAFVLDFVEQPDVLDGDDGLPCETRHKFDLLVGERTDFLAVNANDADQLIVLEHRDAENGAITADRDGSDHKWIALDVSLRSRNVGDLGDLLRVCRTPKAGIRARMDDRRACLGNAGGALCIATARKPSPS
jgi:hypothetical protein